MACACGEVSATSPGTPASDLLLGRRVVHGELHGRPGVGQPVDHESPMLAWATRSPSSTATAKVARGGVVEAGSVDATTASFAASAALPSTAGDAPARLAGVPMTCGSGVRSTSRLRARPGQGRDVGVGRVRDAVADDQHGPLTGVAEATSAMASSLRGSGPGPGRRPRDPGGRGLPEVVAPRGALTPQLSQ